MLRVLSLWMAILASACCSPSVAQLPDGVSETHGMSSGVPLKSTDDLANEAQLQSRAKEIRANFVRRFGTPDEIKAFENPHDLNPASKHPKSSDVEPARIFDLIFKRVEYQEYSPGATGAQAATNITQKASAKASAKAMGAATREIASFVPFWETAAGAAAAVTAQREVTGAVQQAADASDQVFAAATWKALASILTSEEQADYRNGDYRARARLLFKAGQRILEVAGTPNAFILMVTDPSGIKGPTGITFNYPGGAGTFHEFYPDEVPMTMLSAPGVWRLSEPERWQLTARLQKRFMQDGYEAFTGSDASSFLSKLNEPRGNYRSELLAAFGPTAETQYQAASEEEKIAMTKTAIMMTVAATVILGTRIGS